jgi:tetratricopeptide (TPR) repeat protein
MKRTIVIFSLICLIILGLFGANQLPLMAQSSAPAVDTMATAQQLYENGHFALASQAYEQLVAQGFGGKALFYNLGNAYYQQGDFGRAILNYRRAQQLAPRDEDIKANLELARTEVANPVKLSEPTDFLSRIGRLSQNWFALNELGMISLALWLLFAGLVIALTNSPQGSALREKFRVAALGTALALVLSMTGFVSFLYVENSQTQAVVVAQEVQLAASLGAQSASDLVLHQGAEVAVLEQRENWVHLALPADQGQGWVLADAVAIVNN